MSLYDDYEHNPIVISSITIESKCWRKDGKCIKFRDMDTEYLLNAIKFCIEREESVPVNLIAEYLIRKED